MIDPRRYLRYIRRNLLRRAETLYESSNVQVTQDDETIRFRTDNKYSDHNYVIVNGQKHKLKDNELEFSEEFIQNNNAAVVHGHKTKFVMGDDYSDKTVNIYLNEKQITQVSNLTLLGDDPFANNTFDVLVSKLGSFWCISVSGLLNNVSYPLKVEFNSSYPDLTINQISGSDGGEIDLMDLEQRFITCEFPPDMSGDIRVLGRSDDIKKVNRQRRPLTSYKTSPMYVDEIEEVQERIERWNDMSGEVVAIPNHYTTVSKEVELSQEDTTVEFEPSEFTELGTLILNYPENVDVNPRISYKKTEHDTSKHDKRNWERDGNTIRFDQRIIPSEKLRVFHNQGFMFEEGPLKLSIDPGEVKEIDVELTQTETEFTVKNDINDSVVVYLNDDSKYIESGDTETITSEITDKNAFSIQSTDGEMLVSETLSRDEVLNQNNSTVSQLKN